ncbi:MAG: DUF2314 domain-containing protein [Hyphomicrobiales bacterium]|nr:DUF2314 domain-containing protein [Hyphomicrobiales bacterium]MCP4999290.1 DUF2314 domain-containing protein [Hyphomicrobiales bacterium]
MTILLRALCIVLLVAFSYRPLFSQVIDNDEVVSVPSTDRQMNAAIKRARETLPIFWKANKRPTAGKHSFSLKVRITDGTSDEHFWLDKIGVTDGDIEGSINNEPRFVMTVKFGQRYKIPEKDISDWMYIQGGKIYGGFTLRAMLHRLSAADAARMKKELAFQPK